MRYWKCLENNKGAESFTIGKIYESDDEGYNVINDGGFEYGKYMTIVNDDTITTLNDWCEFKEVTYEDYILQEFTSGKIGVQFKDDDACEYWSEKLKLACIKDKVINGWKLSTPMEEDSDVYYVHNNHIYWDDECEIDNVIVLEANEDNKKENKEMNKKEFTKENLKDGMIVEFRSPLVEGSKHLVLNGYFMNNNTRDYHLLNCIDNKLNDNSSDHSYDIIKVFETEGNKLDNIFNENNLKLIWEREEDLMMKEYLNVDKNISIEPNGNSYDDDEDENIWIKKENNEWGDEECISLTIEEAKFMVDSLSDILNNLDK